LLWDLGRALPTEPAALLAWSVMSNAARWFFVLVVLASAVFCILLGMNLLPTKARADQIGTTVPLFITWGLIGITLIMSVAVAAFLLLKGGDTDSPAI
jgi:hypothetical protein